MSTVKISELPVLSSADAADEFVVVDDSAGVTKKITFDSLATDVRSESEPLTASTVTASGLVTASAGINFGADTLDDYEEGTFSFSITGSGGGSVNVDGNAKYFKIGSIVHCVVGFYNKDTSSLSGNFEFAGLPYTVGTGARASEAVWFRGGGNVSFGDAVHMNFNGSTTDGSFVFSTSNASGRNDVTVSSNLTMFASFRYFTGQ